MPKHLDNVYHVTVEVSVPFTVPERRVRQLLTDAVVTERNNAHQTDDISHAKIEVMSIRRLVK